VFVFKVRRTVGLSIYILLECSQLTLTGAIHTLNKKIRLVISVM